MTPKLKLTEGEGPACRLVISVHEKSILDKRLEAKQRQKINK